MYRTNKVKLRKLDSESQPSICIKFKENLSNADETLEKTNHNSVRTTAKILNLLKKSIQKQNEEIQEQCSSLEERQEKPIGNTENTSSNSNNNKIVFNVVIGKISMRKHKKWDDDGILEVTGKHAVLKDTEGKVIHRTMVNPEVLVEGFRMHIENKEIEILERRSSSSNLNDISCQEEVLPPPTKRLKTSNSKQYRSLTSLYKGLRLRCEPLVMPPLNAYKSWLEDHELENEKEICVDPCLVNVLRPHQRHGVIFMYECIMGLKVPEYFGVILADEMGLGKTLQCITVIWTLLTKGPHGRPVFKNVLIVTPSSLCTNWSKEFKRWLGFHRISPYIVNGKNRPEDYKKQIKNSVMIISYNMLIKCSEEIEQLNFDLIVCDEGHRLKNADIKAAKILHNLNCKRRILLTGTPIQNDLQEFFTLVDFINPGILGSSQEFKSYYENPIITSRYSNVPCHATSLGTERAEELHEKTKAFILRRTQETINQYLPSKHELIVFCRLSDEQEKLYSNLTNAWFNDSNDIPHLTLITALKKICNHPKLFYSEKNELLQSKHSIVNKSSNVKCVSEKAYCGKISIVRTLMRNLKKTDEKLVLVSYFTQTLDLLESVCNSEGLYFYRLDGSTNNSTRSKIIEQFNSEDNNNKVFLLSAKAGGVGLNLPGASRLVLFDSDWNPASDSQAMARIWRDGQKKDVYILRLLMAGTIEEKIFQRQISKAGLSETIVDSNSFASLKLSISELKDLFTLNTKTNCLTHDLMGCNCNGYKKMEEKVGEEEHLDNRDCQLFLKDYSEKRNLTINQLLEWEHYEQPIPDELIKEIMLSEVSNDITFILKVSTITKGD